MKYRINWQKMHSGVLYAIIGAGLAVSTLALWAFAIVTSAMLG